MPSLYVIVQNEYGQTWGVRKTGRKDRLADLERLTLMWRKSSPWDCKVEVLERLLGDEGLYTRSPHRIRKTSLSDWESLRIKAWRVDKSTRDGRVPPGKVRKRLNAKVKSSGRKRTATYSQTLESVSDNTLMIEASLPDQSPVKAAAWFERNGSEWVAQAYSCTEIKESDNFPALYPFDKGLAQTLDEGLQSLAFEAPLHIESTVATEASNTQPPLLQGGHLYLGFSFGANLQAAVRSQVPLVLISEHVEQGPQNPLNHWRSTPFGLELRDITLSDCLLQVITEVVDGEAYSATYLSAVGPDGRRYSAALGNDNCVLRWNLDLAPELDFDPSEDHENDDEANRTLAGEEDEFFLDNDQDYPPLGELSDFDGWIGAQGWRTDGIEAKVYQSLADAQLLHLQFGTSLTTLGVTDVALTFRGTPTRDPASDDFVYARSLFRVAVGQPFENGRFGNHEAHLRMRVHNIDCEGYFEPNGSFLTLWPRDAGDIVSLIQAYEVPIADGVVPSPDEFNVRLGLDTAIMEFYISNGEEDFFHQTSD